MTAKKLSAGAPTGRTAHWHSIDWAKCRREVRRLQARIVKATQEGRQGRVKALQWLLTHSFIANRLKNDYRKCPDMWQRSIAGCYQNNVA